jgi:hypothetical protein
MKRTSLRNLTLVVALIVLMAATGAITASPVGQTSNKSAAVDPAALAALDHMGAYLRTLKSFQVEAVVQREEVLDNGLKVQFQGVGSLIAQKPDRLRVDISSDRQERQFLYNGKQFTLWARRVNYYATVPAPPTISELASTLEKKFGIEMPFVDLFRWGTSATSSAGITAAVDLGSSTVDGTTCQQYAFRQKGLDWQIWIQKGDSPLPRKLVLTTTTDSARPQYQATYTWNMAPTLNDADFTFEPPADALRIVLDEITPEAGASKKEK